MMGQSLPWGSQIAVKKIIFTDYMENHNSKQYLQSVWLLGESQHQTVLAIGMITRRITTSNNTCNLYDYMENRNIKQYLQSVWLLGESQHGESQYQAKLAICMIKWRITTTNNTCNLYVFHERKHFNQTSREFWKWY